MDDPKTIRLSIILNLGSMTFMIAARNLSCNILGVVFVLHSEMHIFKSFIDPNPFGLPVS